MDIKEKVNGIIFEVLKERITYDQIKPDKSIIEDLNAESVEILEIFLSLVAEFDVDIKREDVIKFQCINDIYNYIENELKRKLATD